MANNENLQGFHTAETDLAQVFKDLAKGERTASAMESQLTSLERKIDDLLASVDSEDGSKQISNKPGETKDKNRPT